MRTGGDITTGERTLRWFRPLDYDFMLFQKYYLFGLRQCLGSANIRPYPTRLNLPHSFMGMGMTRYGRYANIQINRLLGLLPELPSRDASLASERHQKFVGQYVLHDRSGRTIKFAIDAGDEWWPLSPGILDWSDVYFKSNRWPDFAYPDKVLPIVNCNGYLVAGHGKPLERLKSLRNSEKKWDLVFVTRLYEAGPTHGMKHTARLFEALAGLNCKKFLMPIFTREASTKDEELGKSLEDRLSRVGVEVVHRKLMPMDRLWELQASARLVVLRAGAMRCIPWRMLDLLCMGACVVYDATPVPRWPVPLRGGENFIDLGIRRAEDADEGPLEDYERVPQIVEQALRDQELQDRLRHNNAEYYDNHASPMRVAEYALSNLTGGGVVSGSDRQSAS